MTTPCLPLLGCTVQRTVYAMSIYVPHIFVKREVLDFTKLSFGERLKLAREGAGLTQVQLARALGVAQNQISIWEKGPTGPKRDRLPAIVGLVGGTIEWLLTGKGVAPHPASKTPPALPVTEEERLPVVEVRSPRKPRKRRRAQGSRPQRPPTRPPAPQEPPK